MERSTSSARISLLAEWYDVPSPAQCNAVTNMTTDALVQRHYLLLPLPPRSENR